MIFHLKTAVLLFRTIQYQYVSSAVQQFCSVHHSRIFISFLKKSRKKCLYDRFNQPSTRIGINLELGTAVSTGNKIFRNSNSLEIPQPIEVEAKSNLSLMLKEEEQGEEVLALPSPGTLNDMMSKVQTAVCEDADVGLSLMMYCCFTDGDRAGRGEKDEGKEPILFQSQ
ncbi:hypothetical protein WUBG_00229 [Wuchereria bancrofti]|uniref:Uncharacterized protein n=1 Tax=Wuchereria bancrofti TaxID=6293 RepID=J9F2W2_WUCBA|nr:hypothetical protein WUBG_00229 [Wuchereria bancrofti]